MTLAHETPTRVAATPAPRDRSVDLVRAVCVVVVVLLHALMVGVTVDPSGPVFVNAADGAVWFGPLTWFAQVMPLFFVIGGFAAATAYRRSRAHGGTAVAFVIGRVRRLAVPAIVVIAVAGIALTTLLAAGAPTEIVDVAGYRFGQPLWFLGVFLLCQALAPALLAAHERAPRRTLTALAGSAVVVDIVRAVTGVEAVGLLNLAFVWLALQQLGFFLADGRIDRPRRRTRGAIAATAVAGLILAFATGVYSPDLFVNLNPPTTALVIVGVAQTVVFSLSRPWLVRLAARPRLAAATGFVTERAMTIYLWHMPVLLTMAGASALLAMSGAVTLPAPSSAEWWLGRPLWLALAVMLTMLVAAALGRIERVRLPTPTASAVRTAQAVVLGLASVVLVLAVGTRPVTAVVAAVLLAAAVRRTVEPRNRMDRHREGRVTERRNRLRGEHPRSRDAAASG